MSVRKRELGFEGTVDTQISSASSTNGRLAERLTKEPTSRIHVLRCRDAQ